MPEGWSSDHILGERVARFDKLVPLGIFRGFRNESGEKALVFAINGNSGPGRVEWPQELLDRAAAKGCSLDEIGNLLESGASQ